MFETCRCLGLHPLGTKVERTEYLLHLYLQNTYTWVSLNADVINSFPPSEEKNVHSEIQLLKLTFAKSM